MKLPLLHSDLPSADDYLPGHGDRSWSARHYDLDLDYDVSANRLRARATVDLVALTQLDRLVLDLAHLDVDKVTVDGRKPARYTQREDRLIVRLQQPLPPGRACRVVVKYSGHPAPLADRHHGEAGWEELDDGVLVAGQPHGAPSWFPCNDRPDDKAPYRITVRTQPDYTVVANGLLVSRTRHGSSVTWVYEQDEPMATYLATVQIGHYEVRELESSTPIIAFVPPGTEDGFGAGFGRQPEMMRTFTELFGPYPFAVYSAVVTSDVLEIPLEAQSLSTFGSNFVSADWGAVRLVAHELAHQWFGNAVTVGAWRDIWLHEGFACYAEWIWSEASGGESADAHARRHHERLAGLDQDLVLADPGPDAMFDDRVYKRGALLLHALRLTLGDDEFFALLRSWVADNSGGTVSTADFRAHVAARADGDLDDLFDAWLVKTPLPDLPPAS